MNIGDLVRVLEDKKDKKIYVNCCENFNFSDVIGFDVEDIFNVREVGNKVILDVSVSNVGRGKRKLRKR